MELTKYNVYDMAYSATFSAFIAVSTAFDCAKRIYGHRTEVRDKLLEAHKLLSEVNKLTMADREASRGE